MARFESAFLRADVVAGLTTAAVVVPKAMAYATIAGLPLQVGLYTAFVPMIVYAVLGSSNVLSVSTTTTIAILTATQLGVAVPNGDPAALLEASALLTALVGLILVLAAALRLGFVANFISEPVLVGFKAGIGVVILLDQVPKLLGVHFPKGTFVENLHSLALALPETSLTTLAVAIGTIVVLVSVESFRPRWPAPLLAVGAAIACAMGFAWERHGIELVGAIPTGLPAFSPPMSLALLEVLWPGAIGIALMSFTETIAVGRAFAARDEPMPRPNVELFATGAANVAGAMFGAMPGGGGMSQTAVNRRAGARTRIAGVVTAAATLATMFLLAPYIGFMPQATLAAVVMVYSVGLIEPRAFRDIARVRRMELTWAVAAFLGVMLLGTLKGIVVAIVVSLIALSQQVANPPVHVLGRVRGTNVFRPQSPRRSASARDESPQRSASAREESPQRSASARDESPQRRASAREESPQRSASAREESPQRRAPARDESADDEIEPGLMLVRLEGRLFFLNAERVAEKLRVLQQEWQPRVVVLDLSAVFDLEYSALTMLTAAEERQREAGVEIWLAGLSPDVAAVIARAPLGGTLGPERIFLGLDEAVRKFRARSAAA